MVSKYWPEKVEMKAYNICWERFNEREEAISLEDARSQAAAELSSSFLASDDFVNAFLLEGGHFMPDIEQFRTEPEKVLEEEEVLSL
jgi:hypothetical protein